MPSELNARWQPSRFDLYPEQSRDPRKVARPHDDDLPPALSRPGVRTGAATSLACWPRSDRSSSASPRVGKRHDFDRIFAADRPHRGRWAGDGGFRANWSSASRNEITRCRRSWSRVRTSLGFSFEIGGEGALNSYFLPPCPAVSELTSYGYAVPIDASDRRCAVAACLRRGLRQLRQDALPAVRFDGGINFEFSHLMVPGDASVAAASSPQAEPDARLEVRHRMGRPAVGRRTVAQLDFYDFISLAELSVKRVNGGNAQLHPQRAWEFRGDDRSSVTRLRPGQARPWRRPGQPAPGPDPHLRRVRRSSSMLLAISGPAPATSPSSPSICRCRACGAASGSRAAERSSVPESS